LDQAEGLEDLLHALPDLTGEVEIHLRGVSSAGFETWLSGSVSPDWKNRIFLHPLVSNDELLSRIAEHDIGFAGEMKYCRSRDLTVTNKILYYLLGGLAVVASDTSGQREIAVESPEAVLIYRSGDAQELAERLNALLCSPERLRLAKAASLRAAKGAFCWERQEVALLDAVERALARAA
jgi:glycosyltransferase involved in cell wall biosynthesis